VEGVTIEDNVFVGHGVMFINDRYPRSTNQDGSLQTADNWECIPTVISKRSFVGQQCDNPVRGDGGAKARLLVPVVWLLKMYLLLRWWPETGRTYLRKVTLPEKP